MHLLYLQLTLENMSLSNRKLMNCPLKFQNSMLNFPSQKSLFSIDKLKYDDGAVKFYTGFPNFSSLESVFEYLAPKLDNISYWRGSKSHDVSKDKRDRPDEHGKSVGVYRISIFRIRPEPDLPAMTGFFYNNKVLRFFARKCIARRTKRTVLSIYHPVFLFPDDKHFQVKSTSKALVLSSKQILYFLKNKRWLIFCLK